MFFEHVYDKTLAQASYVIGCQAAGVAAVIDPKRDVDTYLKIAQENDLRITHVLETHIHADFLAGSQELAKLTGAQLYLSAEGGPDWQYAFAHNPLRHGDVVKLGKLLIEAIHTPGHTPESLSFLLTDTPATAAPVMLFTGDFVFVGDVGRPDLLEQAAGMVGTQEQGAHDLFAALQDFVKLADYIQLWPGHGAGSACGKALGAVPLSTVGYEKIRNWALQLLHDRSAFARELLKDQPEPPRYFAKMKELNKVARPLLTQVPQLKNLTTQEWQQVVQNKYPIIDTRSPRFFKDAYLPGSINIVNNNSLATWAGWFLDYDTPFVLIAEHAQTEDIARKLMRIGLDKMHGYMTPQQLAEGAAGKLESYQPMDKSTLKKHLADGSIQLLDVRAATEFKEASIPQAEHLFLGTLPQNLAKVATDKPVAVHCQSGTRSSIAYSILRAHGFQNIHNYAGGMNDWQQDEVG